MSEMTTLHAEKRDRAGKGSARAARRAGRIPAVIYGDRKDPLSITIDQNTFNKLVHQPGIFTNLVRLEVEGSGHEVLTRDIQFHPVTDVPLHVDFLRIGKGQMITVAVSVEFQNEEASPGLKTGGVLNIVRHEVELVCPANAIPEKLVVDLSGAAVGDSIHISAVSLPDGVTPSITDRDFTIATIAAPSGGMSETETTEEEESAETTETEE